MASNVNVKFVGILAAVLVAVFLGVAVTGYVMLSRSGDDLMRLGDQHMAEGDYESAERFYSRAVAKEQRNVQYLAKWIESLEHLVPGTREEYFQKFQMYISAHRAIADALPHEVEPKLDELELRYRWLQRGGAQLADWEAFAEEARSAARPYENNPAAAAKVLRYRALARVAIQNLGVELPAAEQASIEEDLLAALEVTPDDERAVVALANYYRNRADRERTRNNHARAGEFIAEATDLLEKFIDEHQPAPGARLQLVQTLASESSRRIGAGAQTRAVLEAHADRIDGVVRAILETDPESLDPLVVSSAAIIAALGHEDGREAALAVLDHAAGTTRADPIYAFQRGRVEFTLGNTEAAIEQFERVVNLPDLPVSLEGLTLLGLRGEAVRQQINAAMTDWERADTTAERAEAIGRAKRLRDKLVAHVGERAPPVLLVDGRIRFAEGDYSGARPILSQYVDLTAGSDLEGLLLLAEVLLRLNSPGAAKSQLERVLTANPNHIGALMTLGNIEAGLGNRETAERYFRSVLQLRPDYERAQQRLTALGEETADGEREEDPVRRALLEANTALQGRSPDTQAAAARLHLAVDEHGADPRLVLALVQILAQDGDWEGARAVAHAAIEQNPGDENIRQIERFLAHDDPVEATLAAIDNLDLTEIDRRLRRHSTFAGFGRAEEAERELAAALDADPRHPAVVEAAFQHALRTGDTTRAEQLARTAASHNIDSVDGLTYAARLEISRGDYERAAGSLTRALEIDRLNTPAWRMLGSVRAEMGRYADAIEAYRRALDLAPTDVASIRNYLRVLQLAGRTDEALRFARESRARARHDTQFNELWIDLETGAPGGDRELALRELRRRAELRPDDLRTRMQIFGLLVEMEQWAEAESELAAIERAAPDSIDVVNLRANYRMARGDAEGAVSVFREYIDSTPRDRLTSAPFILMSRMMLAQNQVDGAAAALRDAREFQDPTQREVDRELAGLLTRAGRFDDAMEIYEELRQGAEGEQRTRITAGIVELNLLSGRYDAAERLAEQALRDAPNDFNLLLLRAQAVAAQGRADNARRLYDEAVAAEPQNPMGYVKRAEFLLGQQDMVRDAVADLDYALRLDASFRPALLTLAQIRLQEGMIDDALDYYQRALDAAPRDDNTRLRMLQISLAVGDGARAAEIVENAVRVHPRNVQWLLTAGETFERLGRARTAATYYERAWNTRATPETALRFVNALLSGSNPEPQRALSVLRSTEIDTDNNPRLLMARARAHAFAERSTEIRPVQESIARAFSLADPARPGVTSAFFDDLRMLYPDPASRLRVLRRLQPADGFRDWHLIRYAAARLEADRNDSEAMNLLQGLAAEADDPELRYAAHNQLASLHYIRSAQLALDGQDGAPEIERAVEHYLAAVEIKPDEAEPLNNAAYLLAKNLGRAEEALKYAERAAQLMPRHAAVLDTLGVVRMELDMLEDAERVLRRAVNFAEEARESVPVLLHLAEVKIRQGDRVEAARYLRQVESMLPNVRGQADRHRYEQELERLTAAAQQG